jgi:hypothetical protein
MSEEGYITPPPGLLPPPRTPEGVPQREQIPAVPGGLPLFTPNPPTPSRVGEHGTATPTPPRVEEHGEAARLETPSARLQTAWTAAPTGAPQATPAPAPAPGQRVERPASVAAPTWSLALADGTRVTLTGATYLGRNPSPTGAAPGAQLLPLADPAKSLSKTHALLVPQLDYLMVTDLHSTNGLAVIAPGGAVTVLEPGRTSPVRAGSTLQFGSFAVRVERG